MINQSTRREFIVDLFKIGTMVPQIVKGIRERLRNDEQNVFGQISNNMEDNGAKIVIYAHDLKNELKEVVEKNQGADGKVILTNESVREIIRKRFKLS
ncbi:MAG: hypothetical protein LBT51_11025 [Fusobacteriaceae bacterium]|nr:hypothetical protein [Fusobacteriaceae bacterium]